jgi:bifunctional non-homologous end joining protein LigD
VIQKHAASHLHYDFRLGWNGVLKSWAVAKGPSNITKDKRLAVQVEDHPMEYGGFEGIIPQGQYGGGTVLLWDSGTWEPQPGHTDVDAGLRDGSLKFILHGTRMKGKWALIRMGGKAANETKPNWLLIKEHDAYERSDGDAAITDESPRSVVTGRTLEEIASQRDHVWNSRGEAKPAKSQSAKSKNAGEVKSRVAKAHDVAGCPEERLPEFLSPQLATLAKTAPEQTGWLHELKLDGYRIQARKDGSKVTLLTRTGLDWTDRMKSIASEIRKLDAKSAILDGEVVVLAADGTSSFADLQASFREGERHPLTYFAFDLMHLDGHSLRNLPLTERKLLLASLLNSVRGDEAIVRISEHLESSGAAVFAKACALGAEGIVSKRASSQYTAGRSSSWLKVKCSHEQELVIGGYTLPSNGSRGVGALLLGYYDDRDNLVYAGRAGTGFTQQTHRFLRDLLEPLGVKESAFVDVPPSYRGGAIWVRPKLVAQIAFATWTADHLVRQAAFKGLREDKPATEVRREAPAGNAKARPLKAAATRSAGKAAARMNTVRSGKDAVERSQETKHAAVRLTHPDKILDPESQLTKQQLADYYWAVADHILPYIANRPLSLVRCPEGSTKPCFFQKHTSTALPPGIDTVAVPDKKTGEPEPYITLSTRESLAGLAQMGVLELHPWGSRNDDLEHLDRIVIDLDPDESIAWETLAQSARQTRALLKKLGLESFLKGTGGKGLHIVVPIQPEYDWAAVKQFTHAVALTLEKQAPRLYLTKMNKAARKGKIFIDYLRNERGATAVAPFSPRARAGATVSVPLHWSELDIAERPVFHVADFANWKDRLKRDPWQRLPALKQRIDIERSSRVLN